MQPADIRALSEAWNKVNEYELIPQELAETVQSAVEELWEECVLEEQDLSEEQLEIVLEEAAMEYIEEAKVTFGHDTKEPAKRYSDGSRVGATRRLVRKQVSSAIKRGKEKASGAVAGAKIAGSIAKDEARRAGRNVAHSASKAADAVKSAPGKAKEKAKSGIKGFIKRQAEKVVKRMSEENVAELYKGRHGQSEKEYQDSRSDGGKMISGDSKHSGAAYSSRAIKNTGPNPAGGSKKPQGQGRMTSGARAELQYRKANLRKEELEATGLFTNKEIEAILEVEMSEGYKEIDSAKHGRMYDRYKKLRTAAMKDAQDSGEASGDNRMKMGKMQGVISKSAENLRKKQTKDQLTGRG